MRRLNIYIVIRMNRFFKPYQREGEKERKTSPYHDLSCVNPLFLFLFIIYSSEHCFFIFSLLVCVSMYGIVVSYSQLLSSLLLFIVYAYRLLFWNVFKLLKISIQRRKNAIFFFLLRLCRFFCLVLFMFETK